MQKNKLSESLKFKLTTTLNPYFESRILNKDNIIEITPEKSTIKDFVFPVIVVVAPFLISLIFTKGNFIESLEITWPWSLMCMAICLIIIINNITLDNHVVINFSNHTIIIKGISFSGKTNNVIKFNEIDNFNFKTRNFGESMRYKILTLQLTNGKQVNVQEFVSAEEASIILNEILKQQKAKH